MTVTVTMLQTRRGEDGTLWTSGTSHSATDAFATFLISSNLATGELPPARLSPPTRLSTIVIAAYDTAGKAGADYICSATNATKVIQAALTEMRGTVGRVHLLGGTYYLDDELTVDSPHTTIEGETYGFWEKYSGSNGVYTFPRSTPGAPGGCQLRQLTAGKGVFRVGTNYTNGDTRHKNINFLRLSMYAASGAQSAAAGQGTAIYDNATSDICRIAGCNIQGFTNGINVAWDNPLIYDNNIQDTIGSQSGTGLYGAIIVRGFRGQVYGNVIFQVAGNGLWIGSNGCRVFGNIIGLPNDNGILVTNRDVSIVGNQIAGIGRGSSSGTGDAIVIGNYTTSPTPDSGNKYQVPADACVISGNHIQMVLDDVSGGGNGAAGIGNGIRIGGDSGITRSNCDRAVVTGNYISRGGGANINQTEGSLAGSYAVKIQNSSDICTVTGNTIYGPGWNNGGTAKIYLGTAGGQTGTGAGTACVVGGNGGGGISMNFS